MREVIRRSPGVAPLDVAVAELHNHPEACLLVLGFHNIDIDTYFTHYLEKVHFDGLLRIFADKTIGDNFVDKHPNFNVETINCLIIHREATLLGTFSKYSYNHHITLLMSKLESPTDHRCGW